MGSCQFPGKQELPGCQTGNSCSSYHGLVSERDWYQMFQKRLLAHGPGQLHGSSTGKVLPYLQVLMEKSLQGVLFSQLCRRYFRSNHVPGESQFDLEKVLCKCGEALFAPQPGPFSETSESDLTGLVCSGLTTQQQGPRN